MFELEIGGGKLGECHLTEHVLVASKKHPTIYGYKIFRQGKFQCFYAPVHYYTSLLYCMHMEDIFINDSTFQRLSYENHFDGDCQNNVYFH